MVAMVLEKTVVKNIRKALDENYPGFYFKTHGSMYQMVGLPDIIGCYKGVFIGIEVKTPEYKHKLSKAQKRVIKLITRNGGVAFMAKSPEEAMDKMYEGLTSYATSAGRLLGELAKPKVASLDGHRNRKISSRSKSGRKKVLKSKSL